MGGAATKRNGSTAVRPRRRRRHRIRKTIGLVVLAVVVLALLMAVAAAGAVVGVTKGMPSLAQLQSRTVAQTTVVYDRNGGVIAQLHGATTALSFRRRKSPRP